MKNEETEKKDRRETQMSNSVKIDSAKAYDEFVEIRIPCERGEDLDFCPLANKVANPGLWDSCQNHLVDLVIDLIDRSMQKDVIAVSYRTDSATVVYRHGEDMLAVHENEKIRFYKEIHLSTENKENSSLYE